MSVLLVEDDRDIREALGEALESEGYRVLYANDGRQGLAEARRYHPDLILLDLMMPVMDGWQFRAEQKQDASISGIPVVVCSAVSDMKNIDASEVMQKPCNLEDVLDTVARHRPASF